MTKLTPETLRARAALLRADTMQGLVSIAAHLDAHADAWEDDNAQLRERVNEAKRLFLSVSPLGGYPRLKCYWCHEGVATTHAEDCPYGLWLAATQYDDLSRDLSEAYADNARLRERVSLMHTALRSRGFHAEWLDNGDLRLVPLSEVAHEAAEEEK